MNLAAMSRGRQVRVLQQIKDYEGATIEAGETGEVVHLGTDDVGALAFVGVRLDKFHSELSYWDNVVELHGDDMGFIETYRPWRSPYMRKPATYALVLGTIALLALVVDYIPPSTDKAGATPTCRADLYAPTTVKFDWLKAPTHYRSLKNHLPTLGE